MNKIDFNNLELSEEKIYRINGREVEEEVYKYMKNRTFKENSLIYLCHNIPYPLKAWKEKLKERVEFEDISVEEAIKKARSYNGYYNFEVVRYKVDKEPKTMEDLRSYISKKYFNINNYYGWDLSRLGKTEDEKGVSLTFERILMERVSMLTDSGHNLYREYDGQVMWEGDVDQEKFWDVYKASRPGMWSRDRQKITKLEVKRLIERLRELGLEAEFEVTFRASHKNDMTANYSLAINIDIKDKKIIKDYKSVFSKLDKIFDLYKQ